MAVEAAVLEVAVQGAGGDGLAGAVVIVEHGVVIGQDQVLGAAAQAAAAGQSAEGQDAVGVNDGNILQIHIGAEVVAVIVALVHQLCIVHIVVGVVGDVVVQADLIKGVGVGGVNLGNHAVDDGVIRIVVVIVAVHAVFPVVIQDVDAVVAAAGDVHIIGGDKDSLGIAAVVVHDPGHNHVGPLVGNVGRIAHAGVNLNIVIVVNDKDGGVVHADALAAAVAEVDIGGAAGYDVVALVHAAVGVNKLHVAVILGVADLIAAVALLVILVPGVDIGSAYIIIVIVVEVFVDPDLCPLDSGSAFAVIVQVDGIHRAVQEVGVGFQVVADAAGPGHAGEQDIAVHAVGAVGVEDVVVLIQDQHVLVIQIILNAVVGNRIVKGLAVVVTGAVYRHAGGAGVGGDFAGDHGGRLDGLDLILGHGHQDVVAVGVSAQGAEVLVIQGPVVHGDGEALIGAPADNAFVQIRAVQGIQIQLPVALVVVAVHLGHIGKDVGDGDVVGVVIHEDLRQDTPAGAGGTVVFVAAEVGVDHLILIVILVADILAVDIDIEVDIAVAVYQLVVDIAADHVIQLALLSGGDEGAVRLLGISTDGAGTVSPADSGAAELVGVGLVFLQILKIVFAELLNVVAILGIGAVVVALAVVDLLGRPADDDARTVTSGDGSAAAAGVGHHVGLQGVQAHLGGALTAQAAAHHQPVLVNAGGGGVRGNIHGPAGAGVALAVGIIAQGDQQHLGKGIAGELLGGVEVAVAGAGNDAQGDTVLNVGAAPAAGIHIGEGAAGTAEAVRLITQEHAGNEGGGFLTGEDTVGVEGAVVVAVNDADGGHHVHGFLVADFTVVGEISRVCDGDEAHGHDKRHHQREDLFQIPHDGSSSFLNF